MVKRMVNGERFWTLLLSSVCLLFGERALGWVEYLPEKNVILVTDYSRERPCGPADLLRNDQTFGWDKVAFDSENEFYDLDCGLRVGANDGSTTYFQIGGKNNPNETLIIRGTVKVSPFWLKGENRDVAHHHVWGLGRVNRLTIGDAEGSGVRGRLLIDNRERAGHTLIIGGESGYGSENYGGDLFVHNGLIAPFGDIPIGAGQPTRLIHMGGSSTVELSGATIRGLARGIGRHLIRAKVENARFENCGFGFFAGYQTELTDCVFENCDIGVMGASRNPLVLYGCSFKGNTVNWKLHHYPLIAIDCDIDSYDKGWQHHKQDIFFVSKRHIVMKVVDENGNPVEGAVVQAEPSSPPRAAGFDVFQAVTNQEGETPGRGGKGTLLLSEICVTPSADQANAPQRVDYLYMLTARKGKRSGRIDNVSPAQSWAVSLITILEEKQ